MKKHISKHQGNSSINPGIGILRGVKAHVAA